VGVTLAIGDTYTNIIIGVSATRLHLMGATLVASIKQQHRNVLDYMLVACKAALRGEVPPSLLPTTGHIERFIIPQHSSTNR
jgi:hypothetical protein